MDNLGSTDAEDTKRKDSSCQDTEAFKELAAPMPLVPDPGEKHDHTHPTDPQAIPFDAIQAANPGQSTILSLPEWVENTDTEILVENLDFSDTTLRHSFIRKVYTIVLSQLLLTGLIIFGLMQVPGFNFYARECFPVVFIPPMTIYLTTFACIFCCEGPRRRVPYNYIFLLLFTISLSTMVGILASFYRFEELLIAAGITFIMVLALTLFAFQTKLDFTILNGCGLCLVLALLTLGTAMLATSYGRLRLVYTTIGVLVISVYIVCDTQMIVGGSHRYSISPEEYVFAALVLYLDVMNLFLRILRSLR
ncbi:unnamed protein product, partial [Iphiclides podalirius]